MQLLTEEQRAALLANGADPGANHTPVVKLFNAGGAGTWLLTELDPEEPDLWYGLGDAGVGCPEIGSGRMSEIEAIRGLAGLRVERDLAFEGHYPLTVYLQAALNAEQIVIDTKRLERADAALNPPSRDHTTSHTDPWVPEGASEAHADSAEPIRTGTHPQK